MQRTEVEALVLSTAAIAIAIALDRLGSDAFRILPRLMNPVATTIGACLLGLVGLRVLVGRRWFPSAAAPREGYFAAVMLGAVLPIPMILVDLLGGFPSTLNVPAPASVVFYPAVAVVAEFVFHVIPLAGAAVVAALVPGADERARRIGMAIAALLEPAFQVAAGNPHSPVWATGCVAAQVLMFNLIALVLFRRHGFLIAYVFRLAYYAIWHIVWGNLRLGFLFGG